MPRSKPKKGKPAGRARAKAKASAKVTSAKVKSKKSKQGPKAKVRKPGTGTTPAKAKPRAVAQGESFAQTTKLPAHPSRRTTGPLNVQPRFTDPLRRFSEHENVRSLIEGQAARFEDRTFLIYEEDGREISFKALNERTTAFANVLHELGGRTGTRVAILMENSPEFLFAFLGAMKGGLIAVPFNPTLSTDQMRFQLEDCGATILVVSEGFWDRIQGALHELPGLEAVLVSGAAAQVGEQAIEPHHVGEAPAGSFRVISFEGAIRIADSEGVLANKLRWWDEAQIVYTGHHLKQPRGAILQHRQFLTAARWLSVWLRLGEEQRFMSTLPLFHANSQVVTLFMPLLLGGCVVLSREFSVNRLWRAVERYGVTTLCAVPSMLGILAERETSEARSVRPRGEMPWPMPQESPGTLKLRDEADARERGLARAHDISSLERVICGAAPLPAAVQKNFEQCFLVPVIEGYSMAETTCFAMLNPGDGSRKIGSVGVSVGNKVAVQDEGRRARPLEGDWQPTNLARMSPAVFPTAEIGQPGEICVWGENVLKEYFHRPSLNPQAFAGGWFHTGDVGRQDADGYFFVDGPRDEQIVRDGGQFAPREVDETLHEHAKVETVATIGIGDQRGHQVTTWVVMRKGTFEGGPEEGRLPRDNEQLKAMQEEIREYLSRRLERNKRPSTILFARKLPQDTTGKTRVLELRRSLQGRTPTNEEE